MNSRNRLVTGARIALGDSLAASSATGGTHVSPRYGASPAFSNNHTFPAPHAPSCFSPSSLALSVSHAASTGPPRRAASPSTSAITFFGVPFRSSSTTHQIAPAIVIVLFGEGGYAPLAAPPGLLVRWVSLDRFRVLSKRTHQFLHRILHVARDDAPR